LFASQKAVICRWPVALTADSCLGVCKSVWPLHLGAVYAAVMNEKHFDHHYLHTSHNQVPLTGKQHDRKFQVLLHTHFRCWISGKEEFFSRHSLLKNRKKKNRIFSNAMLSRQRHVVIRCMEIMVVEMLLVPYSCTPTAPRCKFQTLLQTPTQLYVASAIGQQETTGFCDAKKGAMFSTTSFCPDKVNSSWRRSDIHKAVTSKSIQHSRFRPSQSLPHKVSPTITTVNATADNQNSSPKISAKGPSSIGKKKRIKSTYTDL